MFNKNKDNKKEPLIRISRNNSFVWWQKLLVKLGAIVVAIILCGLISNIIAPGSFGVFFENLFVKNFASTRRGVTSFNPQKLVTLLWNTAIYFLIALAVTPSFKMKFWNIGGEGQVLMGAFGALIMMKFVAPSIGNNFLSIVLMLILAIIFGAIWAVIPAIFKCLFNTNETLFTLMLNYVAAAIVAFYCYSWRSTGSTVIGVVNSDTKLGWMPSLTLGGVEYDYIIGIIIVALIGTLVWAYLRFTKHGYEVSVVGGSRNTARYIGIDINKVMIRTLILSGALAGLCGWLMVCAGSHSLTENLVNGRGFTGVLISWLGAFNPLQIAGYSFLVSFISSGSSNAASVIGYSSFVGDILIGVFFFVIIASEFFTNFRIHFNFKTKKEVVTNE